MLFKSNSLKAGGSVAIAGYLYLLILHSTLDARESILCFFHNVVPSLTWFLSHEGYSLFYSNVQITRTSGSTHLEDTFQLFPSTTQSLIQHSQFGSALAQVGGGGAGAVGFCHKPLPCASPQPPAQLLRHTCAPLSSCCVRLTLALKVLFSLGIVNWQNSFHLKSRTLFHGVFFAKIMDYGKMQCCTSTALQCII